MRLLVDVVLAELIQKPTMFVKERDFQMEIAFRILQVLRLQGMGEVEGYNGPGYDRVWSRVSIEPTVPYSRDVTVQTRTSLPLPCIEVSQVRLSPLFDGHPSAAGCLRTAPSIVAASGR